MEIDLFAEDLAKEKLTDEFMGTGFEDALKKAEEKDEQLLVGKFLDIDWEKH